MADESLPNHRYPTRTYYGYGAWNLNRFLFLVIPCLIGLGLWMIAPSGGWLAFFGLVIGLLLVLTPPYQGEIPYERLIRKFESIKIDAWQKGEILEPLEAYDPDEERLLGRVQRRTLQIISDDGSSGQLLGYFSSPRPWRGRETFYLVVEPQVSSPYLDHLDRYSFDTRIPEFIRGMAPHISEASFMSIQLPINLTPIKEHYQNSRLYTGDLQQMSGEIDPLQNQAIAHLEAIQDTIAARQPTTLFVLAIRPNRDQAWEGARPESFTTSEWAVSPLHELLQLASTTARKVGFGVRIPAANELNVITRASMNPVDAQSLYKVWHEESSSGISDLDASTFQAGPWPYRVAADKAGIKCGRSHHTFLEVTGFRGNGLVAPGANDHMFVLWDTAGFITHCVDYQVTSSWAEERKLEMITDTRQQLTEKSGLFRPKRDARTQATQSAYQTVAFSGYVIRSSWYVRVTARSIVSRDWLARRTQEELNRGGFESRRITGSSRQVNCLLRTIGCGPQ